MEQGGILVGNDQVIGVAHSGSGMFHYVHLRRTRKEVRLVRAGNATDAVDLARQCSTRIPVALALDGTRTVHRVVLSNGSVQTMLNTAFPHASLDQLMVDGRTIGSGTGLSMMRMEDAQGTMSPLRSAGFRIVHVVIGPWHLLPLRDLLPAAPASFTCAAHRFELKGIDLVAHARDPLASVPLSIGGDTLPQEHISPWAVAWDHFVHGKYPSLFPDQGLEADRKQELYRTWYERGLVALVVVLILLLGADQAFRSMAGPHAFSDAQALRSAEQTVDSLQKKINAQRRLLTGTSASPDRAPVLELAKVVSNVPATVELDRVWASPLARPIREREEPRMDHGRIRIDGSCLDPLVLNSWMMQLREQFTGRDVQLLSLVPGELGHRPRFTLLIAP